MAENPDLLQVSVKALKPSTKEIICDLLNPLKVIPTDEGLPRDWRGLAQLVGLSGEKIPLIKSNSNPTAQILNQWSENSIGLLQNYLGQLDRWDIVDDTEELMKKDAVDYQNSVGRALSSAPLIDVDKDKEILTRDDVIRAERGLTPQTYNAFLLFADEDIDFAMQIVDQMESKYKLKLCYRDRDLVAGLTFEHEAIMRLISERCNRLIVVVSPNFLKSEANKFFVTFAQALGIDHKHRKVVPVLYQRCQLPPELSYYFLLDFTRPGHLWNFWEKLHDSIEAPSSISRSGEFPLMNNANDKMKQPSPDTSGKWSLSPPSKNSDIFKTSSMENLSSVSEISNSKQPNSQEFKSTKKTKSTSMENVRPKTWLKRLLPSHRNKKGGKKVPEAYEC